MGDRAVRVKICGVRRLEDAELAAELGADAIGVLVGQRHPSGDFIDADLAREIVEALPDSVCGVLVSHLEDPGALLELIDQVQPRALQIHSPMAISAVQQIRQACPDLLLHKAVHGSNGNAMEPLQAYEDLVDGFVCDSCNPATGQVGGTGLTHDWSDSAQLVKATSHPLWLAGGLTAGNVSEAIARVQPFGVDVNSGVKGADGFKDRERLQAFLDQVKGGVMGGSREPQ